MNKKGRFILNIIIIVLLTAGLLYIFRGQIFQQFYKPATAPLQEEVEIEDEREAIKVEEKDVEIIAENFQIPWEVAFLPDGVLLVTERSGTLRSIGKEERIYIIEGVEHIGEGGLLGMALHPQFSENRWIYLYLTTKVGNRLENRVERYRLEDAHLLEKTIIINNIPGAAIHNGGRIAFGPDGYLYITTGDAGSPNLAQDINNLAGKILRLKDNGSIPPDNPFGNAVWSYGHRNPQGLTWDDKGRFWATEHGAIAHDELNLIEKGKNYGWPVIQGDEKKEGMENPIIQSGPIETWAPAGIAFWNGSLFFGGLRGETLYEAKIIGERRVSLKTHLRQEFGRIRAVVLGPDGYLYITTSNTNGRGRPRSGDDKIIRINQEIQFECCGILGNIEGDVTHLRTKANLLNLILKNGSSPLITNVFED